MAAVTSAGIMVTPAVAEPAPTSVVWEECPPQVTEPTAECGRVEVPLDHARPDGEKISVGFLRVPASDPAQRRGALFGNPGGPGGDAYSFFGNDSTFHFPAELRAEWDLIAVQPRGLAGSTPVDCTVPPADAEAIAARGDGALAKATCDHQHPGLTDVLTTSQTADDWESVRRALGEDTISLLGLSYGTYLASVYASRYPEHTGRVVLDSAMAPSTAWSQLFVEQRRGYAYAIEDMFAFFADNDDRYGLGTTPLAAFQRWSDVVAQESGIHPSTTPPPATDEDIAEVFGSSGPEIAGSSAADIATETATLRAHITTVIDRLSAGLSEGQPGHLTSPTYQLLWLVLPRPELWDGFAKQIADPQSPEEAGAPTEEQLKEIIKAQVNASGMQQMVVCNENVSGGNPLLIPALQWATRYTVDPRDIIHLGYGSGSLCAGIEPVAALPTLDGSRLTDRPLQISGTRDPQTLYSRHEELAEAMGAHVVTVDGPGHGHVGLHNAAVDDVVVRYLRGEEVTVDRLPGVDPLVVAVE
ncbi:alpha/beta fold hydrolase [Corynebacterium uterequi]|nr:alpha/beta fold hydrolase [Corynebacterium uterequi]